MSNLEAVGTPRISELDSLRGIAALMVLLFHYTTRYPENFGHNSSPFANIGWGQYGVQLFFGISGFVIFWTLRRTSRPMDFVVSRLSRLYPAYWAAIALTTLVVASGALPSLQVAWWIPLANIPMTQGLFRIPDVDGAYWTLLVEICFYGCMLLLFIAKALKRIEPVLCAWIMLSWVWYFRPDFSYTLGALTVQKYIPHFALGIVAYRLQAKETTLLQGALVFLLGLATVAIRQPIGALVTYIAASAALYLLAFGALHLLRAKIFVWLGGVSYSVYLLHEDIGWIVIHAAEHRFGLDANLSILIAATVTIFMAWCVRNFVELPAMREIRRWYRS